MQSPHSGRLFRVRFPELIGWDANRVVVEERELTCRTWTEHGPEVLRQRRLGERCDDPACPYPLWALRAIDPTDLYSHARNRPQARLFRSAGRDQMQAFQDALERFIVHEIESRRPLRIADLRTDDLNDRVNLTLLDLDEEGCRERAHDSAVWEALRGLKDLRSLDGIEVSAPAGWPGRDYALFDAALDDVETEPVGRLNAEVAVPLVGPEAPWWIPRRFRRPPERW